MRTWFTALIVLAMPLVALADDAASVKKQLEADFTKMMAAFSKHDMKGVMGYTADDYEGVGDGGVKMNKAQMETQMKMYMADTKKINSSKFAVSGLKVAGNKATGKTTFSLDALTVDSQGMMGPKGKTHRMTMEQSQNATWTKIGGHWKTSKETPAGAPKMTVDGKPFNPMAPPPPTKKAK